MAGTFYDPANNLGFIPSYLFNATANNLGFIPSYLFNATDASTYIFDYLKVDYHYNFGAGITSDGHIVNWTKVCSTPGWIFLGNGPLIGCLLYPNVTRNIRDGSLPTNLTDIGFSSNAVASYVRSIYPTCLATYCASQPDCAARDVCDVGNLLTSGYELSAQGVAECWLSLCSGYVSSVNADIAGIGVRISRLLSDNMRVCY
jgi:hypothetical protein